MRLLFAKLGLLPAEGTPSGLNGPTINTSETKVFWDIKTLSNSWEWRGILSKRGIILKHVNHIIGIGYNTNIWRVPWLPGGRLLDIYGDRPCYELGMGDRSKVCMVIENGIWNLLPQTPGHLMEIFQLIKSKENPSLVFDDQIIWTPSDNGHFSLRLAVKILHGQKPPPWYDMVWFKGMIPKHYLYLGMVIHKGLKTRDLLSSRIQISNTSCTLCRSSIESCLHFFGDCPYSFEIWKSII